ncbi:hypothetical protein [Olleya sp. ITB9]|uniref:hypothetical protein n=1 Tax=Olleya sp. ITB9 TaxID=1715648 RepID=UPI0006D1161D|nr:hypothetical protein [Olleya sp. ITB9]
MKRKLFIKKIIIASGGIICSSSIVNCSNKKMQLTDLLNKPISILTDYDKNGTKDYGYCIVPSRDYSHEIIMNEDSFVYYENNKIKGYTINVNDNGKETFSSIKQTLVDKFGKSVKVYDNAFGVQFEWNENKKKYTLSKTKQFQNIKQKIIFSESIFDNDLFVF